MCLNARRAATYSAGAPLAGQQREIGSRATSASAVQSRRGALNLRQTSEENTPICGLCAQEMVGNAADRSPRCLFESIAGTSRDDGADCQCSPRSAVDA